MSGNEDRLYWNIGNAGKPGRVAVEKMMLAPTHPPVFAKRAQNVLKTKDWHCKKCARA
jgi:hypothetical protein